MHTYWQTQVPPKPLFPSVAWSKPELRSLAGKLGIIGGNSQSFMAVAESYSLALSTGAGEVKVLLPDSLKKVLPPTMTEVIFAASSSSGSLAQASGPELKALGDWASSLLIIGDLSKNSETAITIEKFVLDYDGALTITRDGFDLLLNTSKELVEREKTLLVLSFSQVQKLFQAVYYPKMMMFNMQLAQAVEALHKFTITYPVTIAAFHKDNLIVASGGEVVTTPWENPMAIWRGSVATRMATYWLWNQDQPLQSAVTSLIEN